MSAIMQKYRERMQHQHGWEVELECPKCGQGGMPEYHGWTPSTAMNFGNNPTIYANLQCSRCGEELRAAAGDKLVELFAEVSTPAGNRRLLVAFIALIVGIPLLLMAGIWAGVHLGWWGAQAFTALSLLALFLMPLIFWFNYQVASIRFRCECGQPAYKFMGLLGRSYCYRCSTCGRLLRLRD